MRFSAQTLGVKSGLDREDRIRQETVGQRRACQGRCQEPRRVRSYAVQVDSGLCGGLTCFKFRFLQRPQDDRQQDRVGQEAAGQRGAAQGRGQEPRRVHSDAVPLGASLHARLACFIFRFLRRPREGLPS